MIESFLRMKSTAKQENNLTLKRTVTSPRYVQTLAPGVCNTKWWSVRGRFLPEENGAPLAGRIGHILPEG